MGAAGCLLGIACGLWAPSLSAQQPVTLEEALRAARLANPQLPVAALDSDVARSQVREAQASKWPRLSAETGISSGTPLAYTTSQAQGQLAATATLLDGGLRRAAVRAAQFRVEVAGAGFRITLKDLELAVRLRFDDFLKSEDEIQLRRQGIARLNSYLSQIEARRAAGHPVASDLLMARVRLGTDRGALAEAEQALDQARLELNQLMGREPGAPLALVSTPPTTPEEAPGDSSWLHAPEVGQAAAARAAAEAAIDIARAERRPQLGLSANVGVVPVLADSNAGTGLSSGTGFGGAVSLSLSWPVWDGGASRARVDRAGLEAEQSRRAEVVAKREARLAWQLAVTQRAHLLQEVEVRARTVPAARDAYLQTESLYNGGAATSLEVLDAYTAWIGASEAYSDAVSRARQADAAALRWGP